MLETDRANVFAVIGGVLRTPPADGRLLPGVTRAAVLRLAGREGVSARETPVTMRELLGASEVFVTNSVQGIVPVRSVTGAAAAWDPGPVTARLQAAFARRPAVAWPLAPARARPAPGPRRVRRPRRLRVPRPPGPGPSAAPARPCAAGPAGPARRSSWSTTTTRSPTTWPTSCSATAARSRSSGTTKSPRATSATSARPASLSHRARVPPPTRVSAWTPSGPARPPSRCSASASGTRPSPPRTAPGSPPRRSPCTAGRP